MNALPVKLLLAITAVAALSLTYPASVQAVPTTYDYTGNTFTSASGPYSTSDFVTAMVTLAGPLAPNMALTVVTPTAFSLSDGVQTITNLNAPHFLFAFATGATGAITAWQVDVLGPHGEIASFNGLLPVLSTGDAGIMGDDEGFNRDLPGSWNMAVPDTGSTLSLMTLTLMALGLVPFQRFNR